MKGEPTEITYGANSGLKSDSDQLSAERRNMKITEARILSQWQNEKIVTTSKLEFVSEAKRRHASEKVLFGWNLIRIGIAMMIHGSDWLRKKWSDDSEQRFD